MKPSRSKQATKYADFYANIQAHAQSMDRTLKNGFGTRCGCTNTHGAKLRLEARLMATSKPYDSVSNDGPDFQVLFHLIPAGHSRSSWNWKETVIRSAPDMQTTLKVSQAESVAPNQPHPSLPRPKIKNGISEVLATIGQSSSGVGGGRLVLDGITR